MQTLQSVSSVSQLLDCKNRRHSPTLEKALCPAPFLVYGILRRSQCHTAAAEGAKLSKIRRGGYATHGRVGTQVESLVKTLFLRFKGSHIVTYQGSH